jgi:hypothetical protein
MNNKKITIAVYVIKYGKNIKNIGILYRRDNSEKKKFYVNFNYLKMRVEVEP